MIEHDWEASAAKADTLPVGWRRHARRAHLDLVDAWTAGPSGRWLKTDLAEEREPARALLPSLSGARWYGLDVSRRAVKCSTACLGVQADVRQLPFADACFDGVLSTSTLDHFDDEADIHVALRELRRVLRPGGVLVLTLDNAAHPLVRLRNALPPSVRQRTGLVPFHVGPTLDLQGGAEALVAAGFYVSRSQPLLHTPHVLGTRAARWPWVERRVLPALDSRASRHRSAGWTGHFAAFRAVVPDLSGPGPGMPGIR